MRRERGQPRSEHPLAEPLPVRCRAVLSHACPWTEIRALVTDRRLHLIKGKKRIKIEISLLFFSDASAARKSSMVSLPSFSFVFLFHASISSSSCSCLLFFLLTFIYSFSPVMWFINHCNAALGKMVLSAGRNTSPLTAPAGRKTLGLLLGSGDGLLMVFAFYVCARAIGAGPRGAFHTPPL